MKRLIYIIALFFSLGAPLTASAVTEKEMDQARAIATLAYLRYANDGSGYLDGVRPAGMADLEKMLKPKEKENLKAFKSIPVPKDYASWDKQKLVEYWSTKAFASKGLTDKGRIGKNRARKNLSAMKVSAPAAPEKAKEKTADNKPEQKPEPTAATPVPSSQPEAPAAPQTAQAPASQTADSTAAALPADPLADNALDALDADPQIEKASDNTWVYVVILCILVGVVVALVVFASNVMKKNGAPGNVENPAPRPTSASSAEANSQREKFAATLTSKNEEIASLSKKVESLNAQNLSLKSNLEGLTAEIASLRTRLAEANTKISHYESAAQALSQVQVQPLSATAPVAAAAQAPQASPAAPSPAPRPAVAPAAVSSPSTVAQGAPQQAAPAVRSIFLGRANQKGIFIRADRNLNPGHSFFRLDTADGFAGTFRVANNIEVWQTALLSPVETLAAACAAPDITATDGASRIVTDTAGTAIFEGGCWKVIRKAKIHFE